jgi:hypothetical protein
MTPEFSMPCWVRPMHMWASNWVCDEKILNESGKTLKNAAVML